MTLQLKPGHDLSDDELRKLEALIEAQYPDEDVVIVYEDAPAAQSAGKQMNFVQQGFVLLLTGIAVLYLVNPTAGILELIPDNLPLIGNLDEAGAVALLLSGLNAFGINVGWLTHLFGGRR